MTAKTEDQIAAEKESVAKMRGAQSAMEAAIRRIDRLENALKIAAGDLADVAKWMPEGAHFQAFDKQARDSRLRSARVVIREMADAAQSVL